MNVFWPYVFVLLASFFNGCMDAWENEANFNESIFKYWDKKVWCKEIASQFSRKVWGYPLNPWHFAKSLMIICFALAIIVFNPIHQWWVHLISIGIIWNLGFWLFYNKLFKVK